MKKLGDINVNDGKGLYDNEGLCDTLISDLNGILKYAACGQYLQACAVVTGMAQKILNLKKGIKDDADSLKGKLEELKRENARLVEQITGLPVDKDVIDNGEHTDLV